MCSHSLCTHVEVIHDRFGYGVNVGMGVLGGISEKTSQCVEIVLVEWDLYLPSRP